MIFFLVSRFANESRSEQRKQTDDTGLLCKSPPMLAVCGAQSDCVKVLLTHLLHGSEALVGELLI